MTFASGMLLFFLTTSFIVIFLLLEYLLIVTIGNHDEFCANAEADIIRSMRWTRLHWRTKRMQSWSDLRSF